MAPSGHPAGVPPRSGATPKVLACSYAKGALPAPFGILRASFLSLNRKEAKEST